MSHQIHVLCITQCSQHGVPSADVGNLVGQQARVWLAYAEFMGHQVRDGEPQVHQVRQEPEQEDTKMNMTIV